MKKAKVMTKFRKKPIVIEAILISDLLYQAEHNFWAMPQWVIDAYEGKTKGIKSLVFASEGIHITTLEGTMLGAPDDWLIQGIQGKLYPCKPDIFKATYEEENCKHTFHQFPGDIKSMKGWTGTEWEKCSHGT